MKASIALALGVSALSPARPGVRPQSLEDLTRFSEWVVVGRVERIVEVPRAPLAASGTAWQIRDSIPIAELAVSRTLHGPPVERLFYLACSTWTCDISGATAGETAVLFLQDSRWMSDEDEAFRAGLAELANGAPVLQIAHSGRGRMRLREVDGRSHAELWTCDVILPDGMTTIQSPASSSSFIRCVSTDVLERFVREQSERVLPMLRASFLPANEGRKGARWSISVWNDGPAGVGFVRGGEWERSLRHAEPATHRARLADMGRVASDARLDNFLLAPFDEPARSLEFRSNQGAWRVGDQVLDPAVEWTGDELELVQRLREQYAKLAEEAHRPISKDR